MGVLTCVGKVFKVITGPLGILEDWAKEPLKRWENERKQSNCNREVERIIRQQTGVETQCCPKRFIDTMNMRLL